jgi:hypothetical protein
MKKILCGVWIVMVVLLASAGRAYAFSVGGEFQKNAPIAVSKASVGVGGGISSNYTKVFVTDAPSVTADDVALIDGRLRGEDPVEFISPKGVAKTDTNTIFK